MSEYIEELRGVIRKLHGVESKHIESVPITEKFNGQTVWDGVVEVFQLIGHPKAFQAFAWSNDADGKKKNHVTVLQIHPIVSAQDAVRAAIIQEFRSLEPAE
jgi:hypothetical protein